MKIPREKNESQKTKIFEKKKQELKFTTILVFAAARAICHISSADSNFNWIQM